MLLLVGKACKQAMALTKLDKTYLAQVKLGETSATDDGEGVKSQVGNRQPTREELLEVLAQLTGEISQVPSAYSAIKIDGREAYKRVRAGEEVSMPTRTVQIYANELIDYSYPYVALKLNVSSGTYIRSVARDLGQMLGTGAYLSALTRSEVGDYRLQDAAELEAVDSASAGRLLRPLEDK